MSHEKEFNKIIRLLDRRLVRTFIFGFNTIFPPSFIIFGTVGICNCCNSFGMIKYKYQILSRPKLFYKLWLRGFRYFRLSLIKLITSRRIANDRK